ncbi:MAG: DUF4173 domain-containing protein [Butyrivibrio sp.]|nr:DUF4173 domain-containing protein [Butyrivibrio sp.]
MNNQQFSTPTPYAQGTQQPYPSTQMYQSITEPDEETIMTKNMKRQFPFFGLASAIYAVFYALCLYKNTSGITYPFFVIGTLCYFFLSMKKLGVPFKKSSLFYVVSIVLLGISNCCTASLQLLLLNKAGIFLLSLILMLHTIYQDKSWSISKYVSAIGRTLGGIFACLLSPFEDMVSFFDAQKQSIKEKNNNFIYILIGVAIAIPLLAVIIALLCSADIVFHKMLNQLFLDFSFAESFSELFKITLLIVVVFFVSYALLTALCQKKVSEEDTDKRVFEPLIAIVVTGMLSVVYLMFSLVQILYLFIGNMQLPDGYTYSAYARQGFFQLLAVCILNLIIVLLCLGLFKDNMILKVILTIISGCTFIMILSSALRMFMYIAQYNLTFLRIFVLWALVVIFLLMCGVTAYIYFHRFPLFFYSVAVTTVLYIGLSFAHPDYWIALYNLNPPFSYEQTDNIGYSYAYITSLSADAAPIILDKRYNPYLSLPMEMMKESAVFDEGDTSYVDTNTNDRLTYYYYKRIFNDSENMNIRNFNFSVYIAHRVSEDY